MVKLDEIPEGQDRIDLACIAEFMDANGNAVPFIGVGEGWLKEKEATEESEAKSAGLKIDLWTGSNFESLFDVDAKVSVDESIIYEDGLYLTQKYTKISGKHLREAMQSLKLKDTGELSKRFYLYRLKPMRSGYPRIVPFAISDREFEEPSE